MHSDSLVEFHLELKNSRLEWSKWKEKREAYSRDLVRCLDEAIKHVCSELEEAARQRSPQSNYEGLLQVEKNNRNHLRLDQLILLKKQAESLKTTSHPGNTIHQIVNRLNKAEVLWKDTTLIDRPLFVLKKIIAFFNPGKSPALFHNRYDKLKLVEQEAKRIKSFSL